MFGIKVCFFSCFIVFLTDGVYGNEWKYHDEDHWDSLCKDGKRQSPIALSDYIATPREFTSLIFDKYSQQVSSLLKNNGHSAEVRLNIHAESKPEIKGGNLPNIYRLDHLHFHWQSEHTIDEYRFPLELHLVHYAKQHDNLTNALKYPQGVAVFAVLFDISPDDDEEFEPLLVIIQKLTEHVDEVKEMQGLTVKNFLPRDTAGYYRYEGSLTTPNCTEGVLWTVFTNTIPISKSQVKIFEEMQTRDKTALKENFRSLQPLNERIVYLRKSPIRSGSEGITITHKLFGLVIVSMAFYFY